VSYLDDRAAHYGQIDGVPQIGAVPALDGQGGIDIVVRIDGTYAEGTYSPEWFADLIEHHRVMYRVDRREADRQVEQ